MNYYKEEVKGGLASAKKQALGFKQFFNKVFQKEGVRKNT